MNKDDCNVPAANVIAHHVTVSLSSATPTGALSNVIVVTTSASGSTKPHGSTGGGGGGGGGGRLLLTSCTQRNSRDELDQRDLINRHECLKLVRELNRDVTAYRSLLLHLGSVGDCDQLREDLKKTRRKSQMLVKDIKNKLVPWITSNNFDIERLNSEWYRIWTIFVCCMDVLFAEMTKTLSLQQTFCLYSDSCSLINAGWNVHDSHNKMMGDNLSLDIFLEKLYAEREETMLLERELVDLQQVIEELKYAIKVKFPNLDSTESLNLIGNNNRFLTNIEPGCQISERSSLNENEDRKCRYNQCACWLVITVIATSLLTTVVILCVVFSS